MMDKTKTAIKEHISAPPRSVSGKKLVVQQSNLLREEMYGDPLEITYGGKNHFAQMGWDQDGDEATLLTDEDGREMVIVGHVIGPVSLKKKSYANSPDRTLDPQKLRNLRINSTRGTRRLRRKDLLHRLAMANERRKARRRRSMMKNMHNRRIAPSAVRRFYNTPISRGMVSVMKVTMWSANVLRSLFSSAETTRSQ